MRTLPVLLALLSIAACSMAGCSPDRPEFPDPSNSGGGTEESGGDGDGDGTTGDGDGSGGTTGDGDGDGSGGTTGDGDGDGSGGTTDDGDGDGSGGTTGDGDDDGSGGTTGDGDGDGSGGTTDDGDGDGSGGTAQVTPPKVLTFSPQNGASGVREDTVLTVTFSEPMDEDSVESAVSLTDHSAGELSFTWNQDSTVLKVSPEDLNYATGTSANSYKLLIESGALDAEGDTLEDDAITTFATLRRVSDTLFPGGVSNSLIYTNVTFETDPVACGSPPYNDRVGDYTYRGSTGAHIMYVAFDLSTLVGTSLVSAVFKAQQLAPDSGFYPGGTVELAMIEPGSIMAYEVNERNVKAKLGTLASMANSAVSLDVTSAVASAPEMNPKQQVFRMTHGIGSPEYTFAHFSCAGFTLDVTYLVP